MADFDKIFLSTLSLRRATRPICRYGEPLIFLSTLSLRRATLNRALAQSEQKFLSTLSLRRATVAVMGPVPDVADFYPRSPCGERHGALKHVHEKEISIHALLAESDSGQPGTFEGIADFYPRSPCGERPGPKVMTPERYYFYPRSPCGERPHIHSTSHGRPGISIHALLAESDQVKNTLCQIVDNFYPRSPCGERHARPTANNATTKFLSTLSLRRAT